MKDQHWAPHYKYVIHVNNDYNFFEMDPLPEEEKDYYQELPKIDEQEEDITILITTCLDEYTVECARELYLSKVRRS